MLVVCGRLSGSGLCLCWIAVFHVVQAATLRKPHSADATHNCKIVSVMRKENGSLSRMAPAVGRPLHIHKDRSSHPVSM